MRFKWGVAAVVVGFGLVCAGQASATMPLLKKAKDAGFPATGCNYCHGEALPKKGAATYNARGKWLMAEKDKRKAQEVDVTWLKDYVEPKDEKK
jgi:hypothetical protein